MTILEAVLGLALGVAVVWAWSLRDMWKKEALELQCQLRNMQFSRDRAVAKMLSETTHYKSVADAVRLDLDVLREEIKERQREYHELQDELETERLKYQEAKHKLFGVEAVLKR